MIQTMTFSKDSVSDELSCFEVSIMSTMPNSEDNADNKVSAAAAASAGTAIEGRTSYEQIPLGNFWMLHPLGAFHQYWDFLVVALCVFSVIEVPILLAFELEVDLEQPVGVASLLVDCFLMLDMVVILRTAYFVRFDASVRLSFCREAATKNLRHGKR